MAQQGRLGLVHGHVGLVQQGVQVRAVVGEQGDTDADGRVQSDVLQGEWLVQGRLQPDGAVHRLVAARIIDQDRELVAAEAGEQLSVAQVLAQSGTHPDQKLVPDVMAQAVVDLLELVKVQQQQGLASPLRGDARLPLGGESQPVRQPSQLIGSGGHAALVGQPRQEAKRQLEAHCRRQQSHPRQDQGDWWHARPGVQEQHPQAREGGPRRHGQRQRTTRRPRREGRLVTRRAVDPQRHQCDSEGPRRVQGRTVHERS